MPPRVKITKESIIETALETVRRFGDNALNARAIAKALDCSTQPVFFNFSSMDDLRREVLFAADGLYREYINREIAAGKYPEYKASGMAYIRFAKEEKELFKLLFMRDRTNENKISEIKDDKMIFDIVKSATGFDEDRARRFHLEMWVFVHGIAVMTATGYLELDEELISKMLTDTYIGIKKRYGDEK